MTLNDIWTISPSIALLVAAFAFLAIDITARNRRLAVYVAIAVLTVALALAFNLWFGWFGEIPLEGFGGLIATDRFAAFFQILILIITIAVLTASLGYAKQLREYRAEFITLLLLSAVGMLLLASSRELITLYVSFELTALPVAAMAALRRDRPSVEAGLKFLILSAVGSALMLFGIVLLYAYSGSTYLSEIGAALAQNATDLTSQYAVLMAFILIVGGLAFKMSVAPWHMWVPDVYQGAPTPVAAFLSTASKASAFAALLTVLYIGFGASGILRQAAIFLGVLAAVSMVYGNLGALRQTDIKRLLGYSTIAQAGYILTGVAAVTALEAGPATTGGSGVSAALYYLAAYAFTNLAVFFIVIAVVKRAADSSIDGLSGLWKSSPLAAIILGVGLLSLLGLPPTAGFIAKIAVFGGAAETGLIWLLIIGVVNSFVAAFYYLRVLRVVFIGEQDADAPRAHKLNFRSDAPELTAGVLATLGVVFFGVLSFIGGDWTADAAQALLRLIPG